MSNKTQQPQATLTIDGKNVELEMLTSTMGERALNLSRLKAKTGCFAYDPATVNTAVCRSAITYVDGDRASCCTAATRLRIWRIIARSLRRPTC